MMCLVVVLLYIFVLIFVVDDFIVICRNFYRIDDCLKMMINFIIESNLIKIFKKKGWLFWFLIEE